jgi:uncharacterized membrane protein
MIDCCNNFRPKSHISAIFEEFFFEIRRIQVRQNSSFPLFPWFGKFCSAKKIGALIIKGLDVVMRNFG